MLHNILHEINEDDRWLEREMAPAQQEDREVEIQGGDQASRRAGEALRDLLRVRLEESERHR